MQIDLLKPPAQDIFRDRKRYILWFIFFMWMACVAVVIGCYAVYSEGPHSFNFEDTALGILVVSSLGVTRYGNRLQKYKALFPPQREKLTLLRAQYPVLEEYCSGVEASKRRIIRAEYEACIDYAKKHENPEAKTEPVESIVYGPEENREQHSSNDSKKQ